MSRDLTPPAFLFYPDDFASDGKVEAMTPEGVGCYILLLCKAWRENPPATIPDDDAILARWARVTDARWLELRSAVLSPFAPSNDGRLVQRRLRREYDKQRLNKKQRSTSGKLGAAARWHSHGETNGTAIAKENESENETDFFELFWIEFPRGRRKSKGKAREAFRKALGKVSTDALSAAAILIAAAKEYAASDEGRGQFVKMPATWLNGECWKDDREAWRDRAAAVKATTQRKAFA